MERLGVKTLPSANNGIEGLSLQQIYSCMVGFLSLSTVSQIKHLEAGLLITYKTRPLPGKKRNVLLHYNSFEME